MLGKSKRQSSISNFFKKRLVSSEGNQNIKVTQGGDRDDSTLDRDDSTLDRVDRTRVDSTRKTTLNNDTPIAIAIDRPGTPAKKRKVTDDRDKGTRYKWLVDTKDKNGVNHSSSESDQRSLLIPKSAWESFTPFEKQFWEIKSKNYDTVVFFKKGKFFELYEDDADIGHQQFDLKLTDRVNMRMVGVPESSFHHWASQFIAKGYKVAKVEQMENAMGKSIRDKQSKPSKDDKIIKRELTSVLTTGTLVDSGFLVSDHATFCMAIKEHQSSPLENPTFGIAFVDTATAEFNLSFFTDDLNRTQFETLVMQVKPKELVLEKSNLSKESLKILRIGLSDSQYNHLIPGLEFWDHEETRRHLESDNYFKKIPVAVKKVIDHREGLSAFGGLLSYLRSLKLDMSLASASNIHIYDPLRQDSSLILDGQTLINLEIFNNSYDGSEKGSLFKLLNNCVTPFGKRLFKKWVCHPLRSTKAINDRLDASEDLFALNDRMDELRDELARFPDLERIIARIHSGNCLVKDFCKCLSAFTQIDSLLESLVAPAENFKSARLSDLVKQKLCRLLIEQLTYFSECFDHSEAIETGKIKMLPGYDEVFDSHQDRLENIKQSLEDFRKQAEKKIKSRIVFKDIGKEVYQMEVLAKIKVPNDWTVMSKTKDVNRYYASSLTTIINQLLEENEHCEAAMRSIKTRIFSKFDENYDLWMKVIKNLAEIDCLISLSIGKRNLTEPYCRPEFCDGEESILELDELRHPCVIETLGGDYIPNDLNLASSKDAMVLLTGPNMGGKSTLLRQTCIAVLMAQLGCHVPARKCRLTPFDRIFTRIGANDNIMAGQSTFMVELAETSKILQDATNRSLVILDELGRGTSTFDGYAIAYAVLHYLVSNIGCLGLFSTHYGTLTKEFISHPLVALKYMSFFVDDESQKVTFLYKLAEGICPESYGMNVARMAHIPESIISVAEKVAADFETQHSFETSSKKSVPLQDLADFRHLMESEDSNILERIKMARRIM